MRIKQNRSALMMLRKELGRTLKSIPDVLVKKYKKHLNCAKSSMTILFAGCKD